MKNTFLYSFVFVAVLILSLVEQSEALSDIHTENCYRRAYKQHYSCLDAADNSFFQCEELREELDIDLDCMPTYMQRLRLCRIQLVLHHIQCYTPVPPATPAPLQVDPAEPLA